MIKTIIVEDNLFMQNHLVQMISNDEHFTLLATFRDAIEMEQSLNRRQVELVLMDVQTLHNHSGLSVGERLKKKSPDIKVILVTSLIDPDILARARSGAADSLWYKDHSETDLLDVILRTMEGEHIFPDSSPSVELKDMFSSEISPRQFDILRRFVKGMTYDEIATDLNISKNGVRWNLDQIMEKGGFQNKHELLAAVIENKLIVTTLRE